MTASNDRGARQLPAIAVNQWMPGWDDIQFTEEGALRRPEPRFYVFSISARDLKALTGIQRRSTAEGLARSLDTRIQRGHEVARSQEIKRFVEFGYPWSEMSKAKRESEQFSDLRKPGWLPTAIIVNILKPGDERLGHFVDSADIVKVDASQERRVSIHLPTAFGGADWVPTSLHPLEVIDGQHRLWAFDDDDSLDGYELPVVAFHGLGISWQAYLFWTINIKPKRINASLAYDLYPLLRTEEWLEKFHGHSIYRETRAQELTELLWAHDLSPWRHRINMLGAAGQGQKQVTQASWVRSLMATVVKRQEARGVQIGGIFGAPLTDRHDLLRWDRVQQGAFLIRFGQHVRDAMIRANAPWAVALRDQKFENTAVVADEQDDPVLYGAQTHLNTDQGIRGLLYVANDLCFVSATHLKLNEWRVNTSETQTDDDAVKVAVDSLAGASVDDFLRRIAESLSEYDWRTSSASGLTEREEREKAALRGSGGYRLLRIDLVTHLSKVGGDIGKAASEVKRRIG